MPFLSLLFTTHVQPWHNSAVNCAYTQYFALILGADTHKRTHSFRRREWPGKYFINDIGNKISSCCRQAAIYQKCNCLCRGPRNYLNPFAGPQCWPGSLAMTLIMCGQAVKATSSKYADSRYEEQIWRRLLTWPTIANLIEIMPTEVNTMLPHIDAYIYTLLHKRVYIDGILIWFRVKAVKAFIFSFAKSASNCCWQFSINLWSGQGHFPFSYISNFERHQCDHHIQWLAFFMSGGVQPLVSRPKVSIF